MIALGGIEAMLHTSRAHPTKKTIQLPGYKVRLDFHCYVYFVNDEDSDLSIWLRNVISHGYKRKSSYSHYANL